MRLVAFSSNLVLLGLGFGLFACGGSVTPGAADEAVLSTTQELPNHSARSGIDFEHDANGNVIADGTKIDTLYAAKGVQFSATYCGGVGGCMQGSVYARALGAATSQHFSPNGVSVMQSGSSAFDVKVGFVEARFRTLVARVSIDAFAAPTSESWLEAYDLNNNLIGRSASQVVGSNGWQAWQTLTVNAPNIARLRFSSDADPYYSENFDNLTFGSGAVRRADLNLTGASTWSGIPLVSFNATGTSSSTVINANQWWAATATAPGVKLVAGDFDGDGNIDLAASGVASWNTVPVAFSNGNGTFNNSNRLRCLPETVVSSTRTPSIPGLRTWPPPLAPSSLISIESTTKVWPFVATARLGRGAQWVTPVS